MRVVVCAWDFPYPARGGGRADVWRRIEAMLQLGHEVMLVNLFDPSGPRVPTPEALQHVDSRVAVRHSFAIRRSRSRTLRQLAGMIRVPWHVATRVPGPDDRAEILRKAQEFAPDLVWLDGPWFGELGRLLSRRLGIPMAYRSHNVEHVYLRRQAAAAAHRRQRVAWRLASVGLRRYQLSLMRDSAGVFDISLSDLEHWRAAGVERISWLPPLSELALAAPSADPVVPLDVLFVGGLRTPNNVQGVRWLVHEVLPLLRAARPGLTLGLVGSYPDPALAQELSSLEGVRTFFDVEDVRPYQRGARVLVNPVAVGSGVQLKTIDMLMTDAPVVTRRQGLSGLPGSCAALVHVADTVTDFADAVLAHLDSPEVDLVAREQERARFGVPAVAAALARLAQASGTPTSTSSPTPSVPGPATSA